MATRRSCRMRWEMHKCRSEAALLHIEDSLFDSTRNEEGVNALRKMLEAMNDIAEKAGEENPFKSFEKHLPSPLNDNETELLNNLMAVNGVKKASVRPYALMIIRSMVVEWYEIQSRVIQVMSDYLNVDPRMLETIQCDCDNPH